MTDVTSHTWVTATILAHAGVKFFHLGCNEGCSRPEVPLLFWWEGPDGSRVLTMCSAAYGSDLCPPRGWPHKSWLCMWMTGDNHGPPNAEEVERLFARAKKDLPGGARPLWPDVGVRRGNFARETGPASDSR